MNSIIRLGGVQDIHWISALLKQGAQLGHFGPTVALQAEALLTAIIANGGVTMTKLRGSIQAPCFILADVKVAEIAGDPASFLVTLKENNELELHLAGTKKEFQRKGAFRNLVKHEIERTNEDVKIFSRCYKKSTWAMGALQKEGFKVTSAGDPIELTLVR